MKFCPNCGYPLEKKQKCNCGYNVETGIVDEKVYGEYKDKIKELYERQCDVMPMDMNYPDLITNARFMGINPSVTDEEVINQFNRPIFNKDNDFITDSSEFIKMDYLHNNQDKVE